MSRLRQLATRPNALLAAVLLVAIGTRFYDLGAESLWLDEAITFHRSRLPIHELIADAWRTYHNPAYFLLIHAWMKVGDSELMLRLPSALFGVFTILFTYGIGRVIAGPWVALGAAIAICLNPKSLEYDQEARMYAPYCLGAAAAMFGTTWLLAHPTEAALRIWRLGKDASGRTLDVKGARQAWLAVALGCIVALYCHATAVLFVCACSIVALVFIATRPLERRGFLLNWVIVNVIVLVAFAPWLPSLFGQSEAIAQKGFWLTQPTGGRVYAAVRAVLFYGWRFAWLNVLVLAAALAGTYALRTKPLVLCALWLFTLLGPGLLLLASLRQPIFMPRLFLWSIIPFSVIIGAGLAAPKWTFVRGACFFVFVGLAGFALVRAYYLPSTKPRWRDAVTLLSNSTGPDVKMLAIARRERRLLRYYTERQSDPIPAFAYTELEGSKPDELEKAIAGAHIIWTIQGHDSPMATAIKAQLKSRGRREQHVSYGEGVIADSYSLPLAARRQR